MTCKGSAVSELGMLNAGEQNPLAGQLRRSIKQRLHPSSVRGRGHGTAPGTGLNEFDGKTSEQMWLHGVISSKTVFSLSTFLPGVYFTFHAADSQNRAKYQRPAPTVMIKRLRYSQ